MTARILLVEDDPTSSLGLERFEREKFRHKREEGE